MSARPAGAFALLVALGALVTLVTLAPGCGYRPVREVAAVPGGVFVVAGEVRVAEPLVISEAVVGARQALAQEGSLHAGGWPRLVIDVTRLEERSAGVLAGVGDTAPRARGSALSLTGRAYVLDSEGAAPGFDSGEMSVSSEAPAGSDARQDALSRDETLRNLARRLGKTLAERMIGYPGAARERL